MRRIAAVSGVWSEPDLPANAGLIAIVTLLLTVWCMRQPAPVRTVALVENAVSALGPLLVLVVGLIGDRSRAARAGCGGLRAPIMPRHRRARLLLRAGVLSYIIGQIIYSIYDQTNSARPFPSWADLAHVAMYPLILLGILRLSLRSLPLSARTRVALDGLMLATAAFAFSWYFILGPEILESGESLLGKGFGALYPLGDLVLAGCLLLLILRRDRGMPPVALGALCVGIACNILADSAYFYETLHNLYAIGQVPINVGYALGMMLIAFGAHAFRPAEDKQTAPVPAIEAPTWLVLAPYALIPAVGVLLVYTQTMSAAPTLKEGVVAGGAALIVLVFVRQFVAMREMHAIHTRNDALIEANRRLAIMATTDPLTRLANRAALREQMGVTLHANKRAALLLLDLDRFKEINDTLGHSAGDEMLGAFAERLRGTFREASMIARLGGDEFAVLLPGAGKDEALATAMSVQRSLQTPFAIEGQTIEMAGSIGIALAPKHGANADTLLRLADIAMYAAKRANAGVAVYDPSQDQLTPRHLALAADLRHALATSALQLHYQPKIDLANGRLIGVEALMRWPRPGEVAVRPDECIALAERTGLIDALTTWALEEALRQARLWIERDGAPSVAVNLSARALHDHTLPDRVAAALQRHSVDPARLTLEVTESALMLDPTRAQAVLERLAALGVRLSIDDFGTGYSSLAYLKDLPVTEVKIDKVFVQHMDVQPKDASIVRSVIAMAHALGLSVVAEGVETESIRAQLAALNCDAVQGYLFARPLPPRELDAWLAANFHQGVRMAAYAALPAPGREGAAYGARVAEVLLPDTLVAPDAITGEIVTIFERDPDRSAIVFGEAGRPTGILTRQRLFARLSHLYGNGLYRHRPVALLLDEGLLAVDCALSLEEAARRATSRPPEQRYDPLVAVDGERYVGLVPVSTLLDHLNTAVAGRMRWSDPLTELPGAPLIRAETTTRLDAGDALALVRLDITGFTAFIDRYGVTRGDEALLILAGLLREVAVEIGGNDLAGHLGSDDFVVLTTPQRVLRYARLNAQFANMMLRLYDPDDLARGGFIGMGRDGRRRYHELLCLHAAIVNAEEVRQPSYDRLLTEATRRALATERDMHMLREIADVHVLPVA